MKRYPEPTVGTYIRNSKKEILLTKSYKWKNGKLWIVPGGHIEWGESIASAAKREAQEEVGLNVDFNRIIYIHEAIFPKEFHKKGHYIFIECECLVKNNQRVQVDNNEIQEAKWFSLEEALRQVTDSWTKKVLQILKTEQNL